MNCTVYTVMEGHGNTTDNQNHHQNLKQGFLFSISFKNKNMYVILFAGETFRGLPKHLLDYTLPLGPRDNMSLGTGLSLPQIFSFFSYGPYSSTYPGQSLIVLAVRKQK